MSVFRRRKNRDRRWCYADLRREAEAAKSEAQDSRNRVAELSETVRREVDALRAERYRNHFAEALTEALYYHEDRQQ